MAKKRKSTRRARRSGGGRRRSGGRRRRRGGGGGGYALMPPREDLKLMGATAVFGYLEAAAKKDTNHFMWKIPKPIDQLGFAGNTALVARAAAHFTKNPWILLFARGAAMIATYQMGRKGGLFSQSGEIFTVSGYSDDDVRVMLDGAMGALHAEGGGNDGGLEWDQQVDAAMAHT